jgi:hypothetical protein
MRNEGLALRSSNRLRNEAIIFRVAMRRLPLLPSLSLSECICDFVYLVTISRAIYQAMVPGSMRHRNKDRCKDHAFAQPQAATVFLDAHSRHTKLPERYPKPCHAHSPFIHVSPCRDREVFGNTKLNSHSNQSRFLKLQAPACENVQRPTLVTGAVGLHSHVSLRKPALFCG